MPEKINYYKISLKEIEDLPKGDKKPTLLIHVCCGPCFCFPVTFLCPHFDVTVYYNNSNIYPPEEFERRLGELKTLLGYIKRDYGYDVDLIVPAYDNVTYMKSLAPYANSREGGERCHVCYKKRMSEAYDFAEEHGFDFFTTVMTISRQKDSQVMNEIGQELEKTHTRTKYFYSDFKKNNGQMIGAQMRKDYGLYNQLYCGCVYSYNEAQDRIKANDGECFKS